MVAAHDSAGNINEVRQQHRLKMYYVCAELWGLVSVTLDAAALFKRGVGGANL